MSCNTVVLRLVCQYWLRTAGSQNHTNKSIRSEKCESTQLDGHRTRPGAARQEWFEYQMENATNFPALRVVSARPAPSRTAVSPAKEIKL